ncbi:hypothetical protein Q8W71_06300 [Methylobacterium sp. NEAU 140]|uniref:hypothetical protein n=1 Tax=Methylobacterium sp. NEAU 140 TaxID=3064945 RepID=UPI002734F377|nr:hypothetical protein [Methylobacterium sp. NEAU 140]MDP4022225.1 hypothetical protein [Methylobacterium sp. NEAU 140]
MSHIQLIEKAVLPTSLWLTFWDLGEQSQISMEIAAPTEIYEVGAVFSLDRDAKFERLALRPVSDGDVSASLRQHLLIPLPARVPRQDHPIVQKSVSIRETSDATTRVHAGLISLIG